MLHWVKKPIATLPWPPTAAEPDEAWAAALGSAVAATVAAATSSVLILRVRIALLGTERAGPSSGHSGLDHASVAERYSPIRPPRQGPGFYQARSASVVRARTGSGRSERVLRCPAYPGFPAGSVLSAPARQRPDRTAHHQARAQQEEAAHGQRHALVPAVERRGGQVRRVQGLDVRPRRARRAGRGRDGAR